MFAEDLSVFVNDFGIDVTFQRGLTTLFTAKLIYDAPPSEVAIYDRSFYDETFYEARVAGADVTLLGVATGITGLQLDDVAPINSVNWYVIGISPDGTGMVSITLSLNKV